MRVRVLKKKKLNKKDKKSRCSDLKKKKIRENVENFLIHLEYEINEKKNRKYFLIVR